MRGGVAGSMIIQQQSQAGQTGRRAVWDPEGQGSLFGKVLCNYCS